MYYQIYIYISRLHTQIDTTFRLKHMSSQFSNRQNNKNTMGAFIPLVSQYAWGATMVGAWDNSRGAVWIPNL